MKFYKGRNGSGANVKVGEMTQKRTGKWWAKRPGGETTRGERESGRNDSGANGKVGETTRIHLNMQRRYISLPLTIIAFA